jgi:hypothetical protein
MGCASSVEKVTSSNEEASGQGVAEAEEIKLREQVLKLEATVHTLQSSLAGLQKDRCAVAIFSMVVCGPFGCCPNFRWPSLVAGPIGMGLLSYHIAKTLAALGWACPLSLLLHYFK